MLRAKYSLSFPRSVRRFGGISCCLGLAAIASCSNSGPAGGSGTGGTTNLGDVSTGGAGGNAVSDGGGASGATSLGGGTWINRTAGTAAAGLPWVDVALDATGTNLVAITTIGTGNPDGNIWTSADAGATYPPTLAEGLGDLRGIALDATNVYWGVDRGDGAGAIMTMPKAGGQTTTLAEGQDPMWAIAVHGADVYWTTTKPTVDFHVVDSTVMTVPCAGGSPRLLASSTTYPSDLAVDGTGVYWVEYFAGTVMKASPGSGSVTTIASGQFYPESIALDAGNIYWTTLPTKEGSTDKGMVVALAR